MIEENRNKKLEKTKIWKKEKDKEKQRGHERKLEKAKKL